MFATLGRSWQFAKISYGIIWDFKKLVIFPLLSTIAAIAVLASFALPLWASGTLEQWMAVLDNEAQQPSTADRGVMWATLFLFYFSSYFVIVFFNSALTACAMKVVNGEAPTVGYGLSMASRRLPQILGWAFVSAVIGVLLKAIENVHEKAGQIVAMILGSAWTALTYFVVPVIVMEGVGPVTAVKRSVGTLRATWGEALVGNFSMGFLALLITLPLLLGCGALVAAGAASGNTPLLAASIAAGVVVLLVATSVTSAADVIFKALLFNYATGQAIPQDIDRGLFQDAFRSRS